MFTASVGVAVSSVLSEEVQAAQENPIQAVIDWTFLSDVADVLSMPGSTPRDVKPKNEGEKE